MVNHSAFTLLAEIHTIQVQLLFSPVVTGVLIFLAGFIVVRVLITVVRWLLPF